VSSNVREVTARIIEDVRRDGDAALRRMALQFDGARLDTIEVPRAACAEALARVAPALRSAMERAAKNIYAVHAAAKPTPVTISPEPGITIVRRPDALRRVGIYAPGGRAVYPSSVLMGAIPARIAGVEEVIVCSPASPSGQPSDLILAAAAIAGVDRVFALGGAGAIAAMAFGTPSVPRVDRIVGPGNAYVAEAKLQVASYVGIDSPAGPSELVVIADDSADPARVATELCAQAEHDPDARVLALTIGAKASSLLMEAVAESLAQQPRRAIIEEVLSARPWIETVDSLGAATARANEIAPEHLLLAVENGDEVAECIRSAGTVFVGQTSSNAFGDYMTGANHVLPTGGLARSYSGLSTLDFIRWTTIQTVTEDAARSLAPDVARFAEAEGLPGHAIAARVAGGLQ
jgi:histidinol dehydrogenase